MPQSPRVIRSSTLLENEAWAPLIVGDFIAGDTLPVTIEGSNGQIDKVGFWKHDGGKLPYARPTSAEMAFIINGRVKVTGPGTTEDTVEAGTGDLLIVPIGFEGTWQTIDPVLKLSISVL